MITKLHFGKTPDGQQVDSYRIVNALGTQMIILNYGAIIQSLSLADKNGVLANVVLSYETLAEYLQDKFYIGAVVGRFSNRIANGKFSIDGKVYNLVQNDRGNHLHGGLKGFSHVVWNAEVISTNTVRLSYESQDGEEGYPGSLKTTVTYTLSDDNEVKAEYTATTDKPTIVSLVQHSYFNLSGKSGSILDHSLSIKSSKYLPVNETGIPTGEMPSVAGSPFDFSKTKSIGSEIERSNEQLHFTNGYDHTWVIDHPKRGINKIAELTERISGRKMEVHTDKPGLHVYSGNFLSGKFQTRSGVCLETQHFPDAPNQSGFPSPILRPGEQYQSTTIFKFSTI